ncbi:hypothetical protein BDN72DRAFT_964722 [Pluteus cervinus]|uniref:Uncharacterized protein n=1 Tax=Pluteus cervinus TaxID=181527 RepID=A0ACD3A9U0_9AGAR|nr:hypothetical protein BDN72DRAFT_964722 [Pluteus cervinus]
MDGLQLSDETQAATKLLVDYVSTAESGSSDAVEPHFSPEIEHKIFVIAFQDDLDMRNVGNLLLVSKRVYEWLIPLVYEIVIIYPFHNWPPMGSLSQNLPRHGKHVRHLLLNLGEEKYLTHCLNLVDLCLVDWDDSLDLSRVLASLNITQLAINLDELPKAPDLIQFCANVTHLDCAYHDWQHFVGPSRWFSYFSNLTHLMVLSDRGAEREDLLVQQILQQLVKLQVLIFCTYRGSGDELQELEVKDVWGDPRVVHLSLRFPCHWKTAAQGGPSHWRFAEEIVERRRDRQRM